MKQVIIIVIFSVMLSCSSKSNRLKHGTIDIDEFGNRTVNTTFSIEEDFSSPQAAELYKTALSFSKNQEHDSALVYMKMANENDNANKLILKDLGSIFAQMNQLDSAKYYIQMSLQIDSTDALSLNNYGLLLYRENKYKEAIKYYNKAILYVANNGLFHVNKALAFSQLNQMDSCCIYLNMAKKYNSYDSKEYINELIEYYGCSKK